MQGIKDMVINTQKTNIHRSVLVSEREDNENDNDDDGDNGKDKCDTSAQNPEINLPKIIQII